MVFGWREREEEKAKEKERERERERSRFSYFGLMSFVEKSKKKVREI